MPAIGFVQLQDDGSYKGQLKTLSIRAEIEITPNHAKRSGSEHPDYVVQSGGIEVGAGWLRTGEVSGREYVSLSLAAPEFGPRRILANLGRAAGQDDETHYAVIWNPRN